MTNDAPAQRARKPISEMKIGDRVIADTHWMEDRYQRGVIVKLSPPGWVNYRNDADGEVWTADPSNIRIVDAPAQGPSGNGQPGDRLEEMTEIARIVSEWRHGPMLSTEALRQISAYTRPPSTVDGDMRAFGASEVAAYRWPDDTPEHRAARAAYCEGAAAVTPPDADGALSLAARLNEAALKIRNLNEALHDLLTRPTDPAARERSRKVVSSVGDWKADHRVTIPVRVGYASPSAGYALARAPSKMADQQRTCNLASAWDELDAAAQRVLTAQPAQMTGAGERLDRARLAMREAITSLLMGFTGLPNTDETRSEMVKCLIASGYFLHDGSIGGLVPSNPGRGYISPDNGQGMGLPPRCTLHLCGGEIVPKDGNNVCSRCGASYGSDEP